MQARKFDELISYFNRKVAEMSIDTKYKNDLLAMVTAIGLAHIKELLTAQPETCKTCYWSCVVVKADKGNILQCENKNGLNRHVSEKDFCSYWEEVTE